MVFNFGDLVTKYDMKITGIIHVGGHYGEEHSTYKKHNINKIVYFEPVKANFEILRQNVGNEAMLYNCALGNDDKNVEMFIERSNDGQSSSILEPALHLQQYPWIQFNEREIVPMRKLDEFNFGDDYNMISIDVQGYELEVFKGAAETLKHIDYIISEINREELYKGCPLIQDLCDFLEPYGFVFCDGVWIGDTWGDGFFVNKRKLN